MKPLSRFHKRVIAWLCLAAMLFAQGAYAAQACLAVEAAMDEMPCHQSEQGGKNICQNHCLASQQTLDINKIPAVATMKYAVQVVSTTVAVAGPAFMPLSSPAERAGAPPLSILHCCFRI